MLGAPESGRRGRGSAPTMREGVTVLVIGREHIAEAHWTCWNDAASSRAGA
jgi:hypothetical protein